MTETGIIEIAQQALLISVKLAAPILLVSLAIGVLISLLQAVTQVQEMTVSFVPKLVGVAAVLLVSGGWMLRELTTFTQQLFASIPSLL